MKSGIDSRPGIIVIKAQGFILIVALRYFLGLNNTYTTVLVHPSLPKIDYYDLEKLS